MLKKRPPRELGRDFWSTLSFLHPFYLDRVMGLCYYYAALGYSEYGYNIGIDQELLGYRGF